jgi:uncharacterized protein DUF6893
MRYLGVLTMVALTVAAVARSIPGVRRYLEIRSM